MSPEKINRTFWVRYQVVRSWDDIDYWHITASVEYKPWYYFLTKKYKVKTITVAKYKHNRYSEQNIISIAKMYIPRTCDNQEGTFKSGITELETR